MAKPEKKNNAKSKKSQIEKVEKGDSEPEEISIEILPKDTPEEIREKIPEEIREKVAIAFQEFRGPLPHPDIMLQYKKVDPSLPQDIFDMAKEEMEHRHEQEKNHLGIEIEVLRENYKTERKEILRGQTFGLIIGLTAIVAGAITAVLGQPIAGIFFGVGGVASLVSVFIMGRNKKQKETK